MKLESTGNYRYSQTYYNVNSLKSEIQFSDVMRPQSLNKVENPSITIVVYEDFLSPFVEYNDRVLQSIIQHFGERVQIIVRNFPITVLHEASQFAALAGICMNDQGQFPTFRSKLLHSVKTDPETTRENIQKLIDTSKEIDQAAFSRCVASSHAQLKLDSDLRNVEELHIMGSPFMTVSSKFETVTVNGATPFDKWDRLLNKMLNRDKWSDAISED